MSYKVRNLIISGLIAHSDFFPTTLVWILEVYDFKAAYTLVTHHQVNIKTINKTEKCMNIDTHINRKKKKKTTIYFISNEYTNLLRQIVFLCQIFKNKLDL